MMQTTLPRRNEDTSARREMKRAAPTLTQAMLEWRIKRECEEAVEAALDDPEFQATMGLI